MSYDPVIKSYGIIDYCSAGYIDHSVLEVRASNPIEEVRKRILSDHLRTNDFKFKNYKRTLRFLPPSLSEIICSYLPSFFRKERAPSKSHGKIFDLK